MTVMGKENLMILKKRSCRINFKVALDFIFKFTYFLKPHSELSVSMRLKNWLWFPVIMCWLCLRPFFIRFSQ